MVESPALAGSCDWTLAWNMSLAAGKAWRVPNVFGLGMLVQPQYGLFEAMDFVLELSLLK
jgi:hypothetical protein